MSGGDLKGRVVDTFRRSQFPKFMVQGGIACGKFYCMVVKYRFWIVCRGSYIRSKILIEAGRKSISNCDREGPSKKAECNQWQLRNGMMEKYGIARVCKV